LAELESEKDIIASDLEKLKVLFHEMTQMCLWCVLNPVTHHRRSEPTALGETPLLSFSARRWLGHSDGLVHQDLSLLTNMTPEDIEHLQTIGRDAQDARKEFILKDDQNVAWEHITTLKDARIDFVLDNGESIIGFYVVFSI
jgi:hypothetical protein